MMPLLMWALLAVASADDALPTCPTTDTTLTGAQLLRTLSLDLRGVIPTVEEYARVGEDGSVPESLIDAWLDSPEFTQQVVRHHRALLWPNVRDIRLLSNRQRLILEGDVWWRYLVAPSYRGGPVYCGDFEAEWDQDGELLRYPDSDGNLQEGWVWVAPYWDPTHTIKVCALEAQENEVSPWGTECDTYDGRFDPYCGCGPHLAWCDTADLGHNGDVENPPVASAIVGDLEQRVAHMIDDDQSYLELLTGRTTYVNGPLVHFYKHHTDVPAHIRFNEVPVDPDTLPDLDFTDQNTWVPVTLGPEQSGILTSTFYLMKYSTHRSRANRFFNAFLCQPFTPPEGGIQNLDNTGASLNLVKRQGCNYCHAILEPAGAHWARWGEYGAGYMDPVHFPVYSDVCAWCAQTGESCSEACSTYYLVDPQSSEEDPYIGSLRAFEFMEGRNEPNAEQGPKLLVAHTVADGRLPTCVARKTASWLLGRDVEGYEKDWLTDLTSDFTTSGFRYRELVKEIVMSDAYRRVR